MIRVCLVLAAVVIWQCMLPDAYGQQRNPLLPDSILVEGKISPRQNVQKQAVQAPVQKAVQKSPAQKNLSAAESRRKSRLERRQNRAGRSLLLRG